MNTNGWSPELRKETADKVREAFKVSAKERKTAARVELNRIKELQSKPAKVDDPAMLAFMQAANLFGDKMPRNIIEDTTRHFKGETGSLRMISEVLDQIGVKYEPLKRSFIDKMVIESAENEIESDIEAGTVGTLSNLSYLADLTEIAENGVKDEPAFNGSMGLI